jgi:signal transduction histidine kinase/CheY-like chemotaxis protein
MTVSLLGRKLPAVATYAVLLGGAFLLLLLTVGVSFWQAERLHTSNVGVQHSFEVRGIAREFLISLLGAEAGQRGYLLTGDAAYLEPFAIAQRRTVEQLDALDAFAANDPALAEDARPLRELAVRKLDELDNTIELRRNGHGAEALLIVRAGRGKEIMDDARAIIDRVIARETAALNGRLEQTEADSRGLRALGLTVAALLVIIGVLLMMAVRNALTVLRASRDEALDAYVRLSDETTSRQEAEAKVSQMQKMEAVGQLTGGVAHDFNNMLAVIMSALSLAQRRLARGDANIASYLEAAHDGARRAATLTGRLLAFARRQPLSPAVLNPNQLVSGMSELLRRTLGASIHMETVLAGGLWNVEVDAAQLENAIVNICVNARDAMEAGGQLTLETANAFLDERYAAQNADVTAGQYAMIAITDTGSGMAPEIIRRAFEPFFTTKEVGKGTGLGLSQVHGFMKQSGGHVSVYSELGHGTTVKLYLPRSTKHIDAEPRSGAREDEAAPAGDPGTIILVVEDEERVRTLSVAALRELGYTVLSAESGARALEILQSQPNIALLFTDIVMPAMSGRVLADTARERHPELCVLFTTGYTQNAIVHNGVVDAGAHLLLKPYSIAELARKVLAVLNQRG